MKKKPRLFKAFQGALNFSFRFARNGVDKDWEVL